MSFLNVYLLCLQRRTPRQALPLPGFYLHLYLINSLIKTLRWESHKRVLPSQALLAIALLKA